jgi:hypothetical protein
MDPQRLIDLLGLAPHPEGGWYRETWRAAAAPGLRSAGSAIYYLVTADAPLRWHRIDSDEIWHFYGGAPLRLSIAAEGAAIASEELGATLDAGQRPQVIVPARAWQRATTLGAWTLVGCTVAPAFEFAHFELAPAGFDPAAGR